MDREKARQAFREKRGYEPPPTWPATPSDQKDAADMLGMAPIHDSEPVEITNDEDHGLFLSALDWADRPFQVVGNLINGNPGAAGRHALDFLGDIVDAPLPGNWIHHLAKPEDQITGSKLAGMTEDDPELLRFAADVGLGTALNPLSYLGFPEAKGLQVAGKTVLGAGKTLNPVVKGIEAAGKLVDKLPDALREPAQAVGRGVRATFGAERVAPELRKVVDDARAAGGLETDAGMASATNALQGLDERQLQIVGDAIDNFAWKDGKLTGELVSTASDPVMGKRSGSIAERIAAHPDVKPGEVERLTAAAEGVTGIGRSMKARPGIFDEAAQGRLSDEYLTRHYAGQEENAAVDQTLGTPSSIKERTQKDWRDVQDFLAQNPKVTYERNALKRLAGRVQQQGTMSTRADIGRGLLELVRSGKLNAPKDVLDRLAKKLETFKAPVPETGAYEDVSPMLGGQATEPAVADAYGLGGFSGKAQPPETAPIEPADVPDVYSLGDQSGKAQPPTTPRILPEGSDIYGIGDQSGRSVVGARTAKQSTELTPAMKEAADALAKSRDFHLADPESRSLVTGVISEIAKHDPESADFIAKAWGGLAPRGTATGVLAKLNPAFKKVAVYGAFIPKINALSRNDIGSLWQTLSNAEARGHLIPALRDAIPAFTKSIDDGIETMFGVRFSHNEFAEAEQALAQSGGSGAAAVAAVKNPDLREALRTGVLNNGFANLEQLVQRSGAEGWKKFFGNWMDMPGVMFKGVEQRVRYGLFKSLKKAGKSSEDAARIVRDTFYDYTATNEKNRTARDIIPFFQFPAKAIPQQAKFLGEKPVVATALGAAFGQDDQDPIYPYLQNKTNIPIGRDEQGNRQLISGFQLPYESLGAIPDFSGDLSHLGRDVEQNVVGAFSPMLKSAFATVAGEDPYFGTPYGSYGKVPLIGEAGAAGRAYNQLAGTGLIQPLDSPLRFVDKLLDERRSLPVKALDTLTGANVVSIDEDRALQQQLQQTLEQNPDVHQYHGLYQTSNDPKTQALLKALNDAKTRVRQKHADEVKKGSVE